MAEEPLLAVENLTVQYEIKNGMLTAVSDATFEVREGEYFGLVGESGCGKSTLALSILGVLDSNGRITEGTIRFKGEEIQDMSDEELNREIRGSELTFIPQGSMNSLDPLERISKHAVKRGEVHADLTAEESLRRFEEMFEVIGIDSERIHNYPHQFSGGMKQRAIIALALFLDPALIVADEPTTALDVIMQDQILAYLDDLVDTTDTSTILITHDIAVVFESCDRLAVMHGGQIAETGTVRDLYHSPRHPYSILLQEAFPDIRYPNRDLAIIEGQPPQQTGAVDHCTFAERCPWVVDECRQHAPQLEPVDADDHLVNCFRRDEVHELYDSDSPRGTVESEGD